MYKFDDELERLRKKVEQATNTKEEKIEFYKKIDLMRSQIEKSYGMPIILNKHIKDKEGKYLVFCKKKRHLREIKEAVIGWFRTAGCKDINAYEVYSDYENKDAEYKAFCEDTSHNLKLLFCVDMLNEGLHLENISGVLLLRPTRSMIVFLQQIGRAIEANNTNTPVIIDAVNNFSSAGRGMKLLGEIKKVIAKEKESNPKFDDSGFEDIDTFFVLENVIEIQEMFREIEGRLDGSWDLYIKALKQYKEREGNCLVSQKHIEFLNDNIELKLGYWVADMRQALKGKQRYILTQERINQLNDLDFVWEKDNSYTKFYRYALLYKNKYGHVNIKYKDQIDGYKIGNACNRLYKDYKKGKLTEEQVNKLKDIGIDITLNNFEKQFKLKMNLARQALKEGVIITQKNNKYKGVDLYNWYLKNKSKFSKEEIEVLQRLIRNMYKPVLIVDIKNCKTIKYSSMSEAGRALCNDFHMVNTERCGITTIFNNLKVRSGNHIYKDRFRFEYAD